MSPYDLNPPGPDEAPRAPKCPICGKTVAADHRPFCSKRCADIDLHRWLAGVYRVESEELPDDAEKPERE